MTTNPWRRWSSIATITVLLASRVVADEVEVPAIGPRPAPSMGERMRRWFGGAPVPVPPQASAAPVASGASPPAKNSPSPRSAVWSWFRRNPSPPQLTAVQFWALEREERARVRKVVE